MLKRNGEVCQYRVPGYAGRLTKMEYNAYTEAMTSVEDQVKQLSEGIQALSDLQNDLPNWRDLPVNGSTETAQVITVKGDQGAPWQILRTISKTSRNEVLFCTRPKGNDQQFGIIEKFDPNSAYARIHGTSEVLMTSNDPKLLIQDHLENERAIFQLFRKDIEATVAESLAEKYPGQNLSRVIRAISGRCQCQESISARSDAGNTTRNRVSIRF
ncbi:MAG: hypothetical protein SFY81_04670 [Verrucomicrobiota bacterium]|nr:hypothetical protein [Verrucomicrobiota bacterium]